MLTLSSPLSNCAMYLTMSHVLMILETEGQPAVSSSNIVVSCVCVCVERSGGAGCSG